LSNCLLVEIDRFGFHDLAEALEYDNPEEVGDKWWDANVRYPWEEFRGVKERIAERYAWIKYEHDHPEGAITVVPTRDMPIDPAPVHGRSA
jgi:hypothetical protein